jgi:hypothetical protein
MFLNHWNDTAVSVLGKYRCVVVDWATKMFSYQLIISPKNVNAVFKELFFFLNSYGVSIISGTGATICTAVVVARCNVRC